MATNLTSPRFFALPCIPHCKHARYDDMTDINEIPILARREIEARIAGPLIRAFVDEFGREDALRVASQVILELAEESGAALAQNCGGNGLDDLAKGTGQWSAGGALKRDILAKSSTAYDYNIVRCKYAEMYKSLGLEDMGFLLSCGRDGKMFGGFNRDIKFTRTQTIMQGAPHCDFRLALQQTSSAPSSEEE
jgi:fumarate reductase iron-sulfur subunit